MPNQSDNPNHNSFEQTFWYKVHCARKRLADASCIMEDYSPLLAFVLVFLICYFIVPSFRDMHAEMSLPLPPITEAAFAIAPWSAILLPVAFVFARFIRTWRRMGRTRPAAMFKVWVVLFFALWIGWFVVAMFMPLIGSMQNINGFETKRQFTPPAPTNSGPVLHLKNLTMAREA